MKWNPAALPPAVQREMQEQRTAFKTKIAAIPDKGVHGFFGPGSASWELYREPIVFVGGLRALLLQIAHPAIADGVHRFSNFKEDALDRGRRTFQAMAKIYFADAETARAVALQLHTIHSYIRGTYPKLQNGQFISQPYSANEPELLLWVLATLTDTTYLVFEKAYGGISQELKERFYEESKVAAALMGIPSDMYPPTLADFQVYFQKMVTGGTLQVDEIGHSLADAILYNRYTNPYLSELLAVAFLPPNLSEAFALNLSAKTIRHSQRLVQAVKTVYRLTPPTLRYAPAYYQARHRIAQYEGQSPELLGRWYNWLAQRVHVPLGI